MPAGKAPGINLEHLNSLQPSRAEEEFLKCCGSQSWARLMTAARPFATLAKLIKESDRIWWSLASADWLEAFRSHPRIGEREAVEQTSFDAHKWSEQEQSGTHDATRDEVRFLADLNSKYEQRFGYIFIVCATGKSANEMLENLEIRLHNEPESELRIAAKEQSRITQLRLQKMIIP
jgi:OHCU decarboxylase